METTTWSKLVTRLEAPRAFYKIVVDGVNDAVSIMAKPEEVDTNDGSPDDNNSTASSEGHESGGHESGGKSPPGDESPDDDDEGPIIDTPDF